MFQVGARIKLTAPFAVRMKGTLWPIELMIDIYRDHSNEPSGFMRGSAQLYFCRFIYPGAITTILWET